MSGAELRRPSSALLIALILALAASWFGTLGYRKLVKSDEGRYAEISREMAASGDWVTPRYNGVKYFEKPVLLYWTTAAAFTLFGESEWTARLWVGLTGFAGIVLTFFTARALFGPPAALAAAAVLASSAIWIAGGHINTTDMGVAFFLHAALCAFLLAQRAGADGASTRRWMLACWAAMALAVLSKGLIGIVLPGLALAAYVGVTRDWSILRRLHLGKGLCLFLAIAAPWFVLVSLRNPEFPWFFFVHEHFGRYTTVEGYNRYGPWWYFLALLALGMLPWTLALPGALAAPLRARAPKDGVDASRMLAIWAIAVTVFFSISRSKLPGYIVPVAPALAMLVGVWLAEAGKRRLVWVCTSALAVGAIALGVMLFLPALNADPRYAPYAPWLRASALVVLAGAAAALALAPMRRAAALVALATAAHVSFQLALLGHDTMRGRFSAYDLAQVVKGEIDRSQPFYSLRTFDHTLPFYTQKTMTLVEFEDELAFGLSLEPQLGVRTLSEFKERWRRDAAPAALMDQALYEVLRSEGLPMRVLVRDERRVVVKKDGPRTSPSS